MTLKAANFILILSIFLLSATRITSFDINELLSKQGGGQFSQFNDLLSRTGLASNINNRQTITVFAVADSAMGSITSKPVEVVKNILAIHVVLDYYDMEKLSGFNDRSPTLTTLFQATGAANGNQGLLTVSVTGSDVKVGSAVNNAQQKATVVKSVVSEPYNISVLQISEPIMTPGIDQLTPSGAPKADSPANAHSPKKSHEHGKSPEGESEDGESESKDDNSSSSSSSTDASSSPDGEKESADKKSSPSHNAASSNNVTPMLPAAFLGLALAF